MVVRAQAENVKDEVCVMREDVAYDLKTWRTTSGLSIVDMAAHLEMDDSYLARLLHPERNVSQSRMLGLHVVDKIYTRLGLPLPPFYVRAWVRLQDD